MKDKGNGKILVDMDNWHEVDFILSSALDSSNIDYIKSQIGLARNRIFDSLKLVVKE